MTTLVNRLLNNEATVIEDILTCIPQIHFEGYKVGTLVTYIDGCNSLIVEAVEGEVSINTASQVSILTATASDLELDLEGDLVDSTYYYSLITARLAELRNNL